MEGIGRLAGGIAHDFNNLLTVDPRQRQPGAGRAAPRRGPAGGSGADRAGRRPRGRLTRQLLAFARRTVLKPEVVNLSAVVRRLEPMLRRLIGEDVTLVTIAPDGTGRVLADPGQIDQVIVNLAVNASEAMPDGGTLTIEVADGIGLGRDPNARPGLPAGPLVTLSVSDTGVGMDDETHSSPLRAVLHDQGPGQGHGPGTGHGLRHRAHVRRDHRRPQPAGPGIDLHRLSAGGGSDCRCRAGAAARGCDPWR